MKSTLGRIPKKKKGYCCQWLAYKSFSLNLPSHSRCLKSRRVPRWDFIWELNEEWWHFCFSAAKTDILLKGGRGKVVGKPGSLYRERDWKQKGNLELDFCQTFLGAIIKQHLLNTKIGSVVIERWKASENPSENAAAEKRRNGRVRHIGGWTFVFVFYCLLLEEKWKKRRKAFHPFGFSRFLVGACVCCTGVFTCLGDNFPFVGENLSRLDSNPFAEVPYSGMCMQFVLLAGVFSRLAVKQFAPLAEQC